MEFVKCKKNSILKWTTAMLLGFVMMANLSTQTYAAPKQMPDGTVFDAEFYAVSYPDVAAVLGTDETMLYNHYLLCGMLEGRLPYQYTEQELKNHEIYQRIMTLKEIYPQGMKWDETNTYVLSQDENRKNGFAGWQVSSCQAFVYTIQEAVFGSSATFNLYETGLEEWCKTYAKGRLRSSNAEPGWVPFGYYGQDSAINAKFEEYWNVLQPGDGLADGGHMSIVLMKANDYVLVAEGNFNGAVNWGGKISKDLLRKSLQYVETPSW